MKGSLSYLQFFQELFEQRPCKGLSSFLPLCITLNLTSGLCLRFGAPKLTNDYDKALLYIRMPDPEQKTQGGESESQGYRCQQNPLEKLCL